MTKPTVSRIERKIEQLEAAHSGPRTPRYLRNWRAGRVLQAIVHEGSDEAETKKRTLEAQEKALAEHIAAHPEDAGRTVEDFFWIVREIGVDGKWEERDGTLKWVREDGTVVRTLGDNYSAAEDPDVAAKDDDLDPPPDLQPALAVSTAETAEAAQIPSPAVPPARSRPYQQSRRVVRSWLAD
jgi:hypothetical protein